MSVHHLKAVFHQTVFIRAEGGKFTSTKSTTISLDSISLQTELVLPIGSKCELEISSLNTASTTAIKVEGLVKEQLSTGLIISFIHLDEIDLERLEGIIMHNTSRPYIFEEEIQNMKEHPEEEEIIFLPKAN